MEAFSNLRLKGRFCGLRKSLKQYKNSVNSKKNMKILKYSKYNFLKDVFI